MLKVTEHSNPLCRFQKFHAWVEATIWLNHFLSFLLLVPVCSFVFHFVFIFSWYHICSQKVLPGGLVNPHLWSHCVAPSSLICLICILSMLVVGLRYHLNMLYYLFCKIKCTWSQGCKNGQCEFWTHDSSLMSIPWPVRAFQCLQCVYSI